MTGVSKPLATNRCLPAGDWLCRIGSLLRCAIGARGGRCTPMPNSDSGIRGSVSYCGVGCSGRSTRSLALQNQDDSGSEAQDIGGRDGQTTSGSAVS